MKIGGAMAAEEPTKILYMEDDLSLGRLLQRRLGREGMVVDIAENGAKGLENCRTGNYAAAIIDYRMPGMNGIEVLRQLQEDGISLPTVMVTGAGDENIAVEAMKLGAGDYVVKDLAGQYLEFMPAIVTRMLEKGRLLLEKQKAERELAEKTALLATTLANIDQGVTLFDADLRLVAWNQRYFDLFDFPAAMARVGTPFVDFVRINAERGEYGPGETEAQIFERVRRARASQIHRYEHVRIDDRVIEVRGGPIPGGGFVATYIDITDRKEAEEEIRASGLRARAAERQLADAVENISEGFAVWGADGRLVLCNEHYRMFYPAIAEEIRPGAVFEDLVRLGIEHHLFPGAIGREEAWIRERLERHYSPGEPFEQQVEEGRWILVSERRMDDGRIVGTRSDITERKAVEEERRRNHELLDYISRFQSRYIGESEAGVFFESLLMDLLRLSRSAHGLIAEVGEDEEGKTYLQTLALSNLAWDEGTRQLYEEKGKTGIRFHNLNNLMGAAIVNGSPVISNDPMNDPRSSGLPAGHQVLRSYLGMPLWRGSGIVGLIGLANRPGGYDETLIMHLKPVFAACSQIIEGYRNQRRREEAEEKIRHMASHDGLTNLPNRALLLDRLSRALAGARRNRSGAAVLFIDLDGFKPVNDTLGHEMGDLLLKEVAVRLGFCVRETDTVGRYGGDEFIVVLTDITERDAVIRGADAINDTLIQPFALDGRKIEISGSVGIALYPEDAAESESLIRIADDAMYAAKQAGKGTHRFAPPPSPPTGDPPP